METEIRRKNLVSRPISIREGRRRTRRYTRPKDFILGPVERSTGRVRVSNYESS